MDRNEMINILNGICERCLMKGLISKVEDAKTLYEVFDRFSNLKYTNDEEYSRDILYFYNLGVQLHENRYTTLEESYSIYNAILSADRIDFVETKEPVMEEVIKVEPVKLNCCKKSKNNEVVVNKSDIIS